jgi:hypothetical protein
VCWRSTRATITAITITTAAAISTKCCDPLNLAIRQLVRELHAAATTGTSHGWRLLGSCGWC